MPHFENDIVYSRLGFTRQELIRALDLASEVESVQDGSEVMNTIRMPWLDARQKSWVAKFTTPNARIPWPAFGYLQLNPNGFDYNPGKVETGDHRPTLLKSSGINREQLEAAHTLVYNLTSIYQPEDLAYTILTDWDEACKEKWVREFASPPNEMAAV